MIFIVSGLTASGKTTLCLALSHVLGIEPHHTSQLYMDNLQEKRPKDERIRAWLNRDPDAHDLAALVAGTKADADHYSMVVEEQVRRTHGVHESLTLPLLLPMSMSICRIMLDVYEPTRIERIAKHYGLPPEEAATVVSRKDKRTNNYMEYVYERSLHNPLYHGSFNALLVGQDGEYDIEFTTDVHREYKQVLREALELVPSIVKGTA